MFWVKTRNNQMVPMPTSLRLGLGFSLWKFWVPPAYGLKHAAACMLEACSMLQHSKFFLGAVGACLTPKQDKFLKIFENFDPNQKIHVCFAPVGVFLFTLCGQNAQYLMGIKEPPTPWGMYGAAELPVFSGAYSYGDVQALNLCTCFATGGVYSQWSCQRLPPCYSSQGNK